MNKIKYDLRKLIKLKWKWFLLKVYLDVAASLWTIVLTLIWTNFFYQ